MADARGGLDAAATRFAFLIFVLSRRPALAPIPLATSSASFRRSRVDHRR
jgi:hypothetical protein